MATMREYLVSLGLAKPGRGRFSGDAKAALAKAIAEGMTFDDVTAPAKSEKTEKSVKMKTVGAKPATTEDFKDISPKAVREWAKANPSLVPEGIVVRDRGRIDLRVYEAYKKNVDKVTTRTDEAEQSYAATPDRRFGDNVKFVGIVNGKTIEVNYKQVCAGEGGCGYSLGWCRCPQNKKNRHVITQHGMIDVEPVYA